MRDDLKTLRHLLSQVTRAAGLGRRQLEERIGVSHGNLDRLFDGQLDLRVRHLVALAQLLEVRPGQLLDLGCPDATAAARQDVEDILAPGRHGAPADLATRKAREREELVALIDTTVQRALAKSGRARRRPPDGSPAE